MTLRQIEYFLKVAETLSFTKAAQELFVSQSVLSQQIKKLEAFVEVPLFARNNRNVELTAAGVLLQKKFTVVTADVTAALEDARKLHLQTHPLRIGLPRILKTNVFLDVLRQGLQAVGVQSEISWEYFYYPELKQALLDGNLDGAIMMDRILEEDSPFLYVPLANCKACLAYADGFVEEATFERFQGKPFIGSDPTPSKDLTQFEWPLLDALGIVPGTRLVQLSTPTVATAVCLGQAFAFMGVDTAQQYRLNYIEIDPPLGDLSVILAYLPNARGAVHHLAQSIDNQK